MSLRVDRKKAEDKSRKRKEKRKRLGLKKPSHSFLVKKADKLFGQIVRSVGHCESGRERHGGPLQCAHLFSRRYEATRWSRPNAVCLCAGCHVFFTHRPLEWDEWMRARMGVYYINWRELALKGGKIDMEIVLHVLTTLQNASQTSTVGSGTTL